MEVANLHLDFLPTEYSKKIWADRYLQSDNDDVFKRVAKVVASKETKLGLTRKEQEKEFLALFENNLFVGGGRHLCNMGGTGNNMPGNCFALPIEDSREGIYKTLFEMAEIESKGGGVGVNFSKLRPRNDIVHGSKGKSSGPCSFIDLYNASISTISQGGCLAAGTKLSTSEGEIEIEKLAQNINFRLAIEEEEYESSAWYSGDKECVTLFFSNGKQLICTLDHPIFTISGILPAERCLDKVCYTKEGTSVVYMVENIGICPTYDFEEKINQYGYANSIKVHNSRRGALIAILDVSHPDIEEFIHAKKDKNRWNNLNISVAISDSFMDAVRRDAEWDLVFGGKVYKTVSATDLWNQICESAAASGEPGVLFLDTINRYSNLGDALIEATNPCFTGSNQLLTSNGRRSFESLVGKGIFYIISPNDNNEYPAKVEPAGIKRCIRLELSNGQVLDLTPEHEIYTDGGKIEAQFALGKELVSDDEEVIVDNIVDIGEQEVYDFSEPVHHVGYVNGCVVSNCGELPLLPYGACNLGSLILPNFFGSNGKLNKDLLAHAVRMAVLYLDNLLDISVWPLEKIKETVLDYRVLGLGVLGLADLLFLEGIPYGNNYKCINYVRDLISFIYNTALQTSEELAKELGPFPKYDKDKMKYAPRRNAQLMAMAPTGTISALYGASWGIEPYFSQTMIRDERIGKDVVSYQVLDKYMRNHDCLPDYARFAVGNTNLLSVDDHLAVLKVVANNIDNAVSKTVNLPKGSTSDDVDRVYKYMFDNNIKGGTVYVEGSRELEAVKVMDTSEDNMDDEDDIDDYIELVDLIAEPKSRPEAIEGVTYKVKYCYEKPSIYITINNFEEEPFEIFFSTKDSSIQEWLDMLARTITALFRRGISCDFLVKDFMQYSSSQCGGRFRGKYIQSASAAIGMVLKEHLRQLGLMPRDADEEGIRKMAKEDSYGLMCPECFEHTLVKQGGCSSCLSCGFSKCE